MTLVSNHSFPRHPYDQFGVGVIGCGAQRSWSGIGTVDASAGDVIMVNPGEMHDGTPLDGNLRGWRMIYLDPILVAREVEEEIVGTVEIVRPVAHDPLPSLHFSQLFSFLTPPQPERLATQGILPRSLIYILRQHWGPRPLANRPAP